MKQPLAIAIILFSCFVHFANAQTPPITRALNHGLSEPQDPATLPVSRSTTKGIAKKTTPPFESAKLTLIADNEYSVRTGWKLQDAEKVDETGVLPFLKDYDVSKWYDATVPGTVLTTLVNEGVYPNPYFGLNNLQIPESLARTEWWYRNEITIPTDKKGSRIQLQFKGVNYVAEVWYNQKKIGKITGAFLRGSFDVTALTRFDGPNVLAIKILPNRFPGIAHEESATAGMGRNGGLLCLDGPTFFCSEGWDWIPSIRDRNIGLWQDVCFKFSGAAILGDSHFVTDLPLPDTTSAQVSVRVPIKNLSQSKEQYTLSVAFDGVMVEKRVSLNAEESVEMVLRSADYPQLIIHNPKLWWPNGMGAQNLYSAKIVLKDNSGRVIDERSTRFGIREYDYQLCVADKKNEQFDIEFNPTAAYQNKQQVFDQINVLRISVQGKDNYLARLLVERESTGIKLEKNSASPYMVLKVNGYKVFCRGGNWGMDDAMKRISRERMEPYFKLHKDEHFNMIRNWTGQSTSPLFYDLCDEYGLLVFNDFWMSTTDFNVAPADNRILMSNITDAVKRYRNHPSIAIWCARNEGFAPELVERKLAKLLIEEDGTRHYLSTSIKLNTTDSGPWESNEPTDYFRPDSNIFAQGFKTEVGSAAFPAYRSAVKYMEKEDLWPIGDVWSYHDWHVNAWPGFQKFQERMVKLYGDFDGIESFCNWSQLENFRVWRGISESWYSNMWNNTTGYLLWMSHPSWPSTVWQTYTYDYDTNGAFFGCKKGSQPLHVQMNLHTRTVSVVNTTISNVDLVVKYRIYSLTGKLIKEESKPVRSDNASIISAFELTNASIPENELSLLRLEISQKNSVVATNEYWLQGKKCNDFKPLRQYTTATVIVGRVQKLKNGNYAIQVKNTSPSPALGVNLLLQNKQSGLQVLPAFFSDGYFTLLPNEERTVQLSDIASIDGLQIVAEWIKK